MSLIRIFLVSFFVLIGLSSNLLAMQSGSTTATLNGSVKDETGAALGGASVTAKNLNTNFEREVFADENGVFLITQLPPGLYDLTAKVAGFSSSSAKLDVVLGTTLLFNFTLKVGANTDIVEVKADSAVEATKTESSINNDRGRIDGLPINRRNFLDFSLTSPRVTPDRTPQQGVAASSGLSFNGLPARNNNITIDGLENNDLGPGAVRSTFSQDAVQEFQVVSDSYSAEFGRALGGVINIVTRGGTNNLSGSLFLLNRNDSLSSRNAFATINPEFKQYQFGATLGGPIKKDKAFFFTSFERLSIKQNSIVSITDDTVKSAAGQGFVFRNGPVPFGVGTTTFLARGDVRLSPSDTLFVRYNYGHTYNGAGEPFGELITGSRVADTNAGVQALTDNNIAFNNTYISTGLNLVNETRFLYSHRNQTIDPTDPDGPQVNLVAPEGQVVFGHGTLLPQPRELSIYQFIDNVALSRGRHQLKFGVDYSYTSAPFIRVPIFEGGFAFFAPINLTSLGGPILNGIEAFDPRLRSAAQRAQLGVLATVLNANVDSFPLLPLADLSIPTFFAQGFLAKKVPGSAASYFSAFGQDDIRIKENFIVKLGLRYDISRVRFTNDTNGNLSPRISFSYRPAKLPKVNIHGAYGLFFAAPLFGPATVAQNSQSGALQVPVIPFPFSTVFFGLPGHHLPIGNTIPPGTPFRQQLSLGFRNQPDQKSSYSQQVNFGVDYFIGNNSVISLSYNFVRGIRIFSQRNTNPITNPIPGDPITSAIVGRPDPTQGDLFEFGTAYDSYYHGFTALYNRRLSSNIGLLASYTFSKAIDNFIDIRNELQQSVDPNNLLAERGLSLQDVRSRFILSGIWELNYTKNIFLKDFSLATIINIESGRPYNLLAGVDLNLNGDNPPGDRPLENGTSIARNRGLTPGFIRTDLRLTRTLKFSDRYRGQIFIEAFNLFNRVNISDVNPIYLPDLNGNFQLPPTDGGRFVATPDRFRSAFAPRQFQLGFRVAF